MSNRLGFGPPLESRTQAQLHRTPIAAVAPFGGRTSVSPAACLATARRPRVLQSAHSESLGASFRMPMRSRMQGRPISVANWSRVLLVHAVRREVAHPEWTC